MNLITSRRDLQTKPARIKSGETSTAAIYGKTLPVRTGSTPVVLLYTLEPTLCHAQTKRYDRGQSATEKRFIDESEILQHKF